MRRIHAFAYELKIWLFDASFKPAVGWLLSAAAYCGFVALQRVRRDTAVTCLLRAHYLLFRTDGFDISSSYLQRRIEAALGHCLAEPEGLGISAGPPATTVEAEAFVSTPAALVLKAPRIDNQAVVEKGALLVKNTQQFRVFRELVDVAAVLRDYVLILEPSWSGYAQRDILYFAQFSTEPIVVMATGEQDYRFLERLATNLVPAPFGASDWANPAVFRPLEGTDKRYDAVLVARWSVVKRHHVLFRALRSLADPSYQVALIAPSWVGDTDRRSIEALMDQKALAGQFTVLEDLSPEEVNVVFNQSRVSLLLSRQEGSNRSLFEGFFAGTPALALVHNVGLPHSYLNAQTGKLIEERALVDELRYFRDGWRDFAPRSWAEARIAPEITTAKLNQLLRTLAGGRGEPWTQDIVAKFNGPELQYYPSRAAGAGLPTVAQLLAQYARRGPPSVRVAV